MSIKILTEQILYKIPRLSKPQHKFIVHLFTLWLSIRGRHNYINLARYGHYNEITYRRQSKKEFAFLAFNRALVQQALCEDCIIAFDPTYVRKSGKCTEGVNYYYSGCAGREKWGLEFGGLAAIDLSDKTALHLEAIQTLDRDDQESLLDYYARQIISRKEGFEGISSLLAVDAFFARTPFIDRICETGLQVVTRLRKDIHMRYLYNGPKRKGRGRPKKYDGQIDLMNLRADQFSPCAKAQDGSWIAYEAVVNIRSWKRKVRLVVEHKLDKQGNIKNYILYACTDLQMSGGEVKLAYNSRFQIEFLYRDAKQSAGLEQAQARSAEQLHFHVNTALTCVSLAKVAHHLTISEEDRKSFSIADICTQYANDLLLNRIILWCGQQPHLHLIKSVRHKVRAFGSRAA